MKTSTNKRALQRPRDSTVEVRIPQAKAAEKYPEKQRETGGRQSLRTTPGEVRPAEIDPLGKGDFGERV